ncbi:MAG: NTP transferase domain-containing protein [Clostridia bacterium]|nr:NTP transferase domain-containing protein [Clostridia bacterium]
MIKIDVKGVKVDNAIILAAGASKDTMYSPPKGLLKVKGVPIIERQISQLKEAGVNDITVVVGYKKEMYFYLEDKYGIQLLGNPRLDKNNVYSLYLAKDKLKNTYVCSCDYYYEENPFSAYENKPYQATSFFEDASDKFAVEVDSNNRITSIVPGKSKAECVNGVAFFDESFSNKMKELLENEINKYRVSSLFWEEFMGKHLDELEISIKHSESSMVREFDDLNSLKTLNVLFVNSVSALIVKNICEQLNCKSEDISNVDILEAGHSNITFKVVVKDKEFVYRYPGVSGKNIVSRKRETYANKLAKKLGIDDTLIFIDESGHKLSYYVANAHPLNKNNKNDLKTLAENVAKIHACETPDADKISNEFDPIEASDKLLTLACSNKDNLFEIFGKMREEVHKIDRALKKDCFRKAICHCNLNSNNCLITEDSFNLIDWEFSGYCDVAYDFPFLGNYDFEEEDLKQYLEFYYQRKPTDFEYRHWLCYRAVHYWYYTCWAIYKESVNEDCGNLLLIFYNQCKKTIELANQLLK